MSSTINSNQKIEWTEKIDISNRLSEFVQRKGSQKKAAVALDISNATISQILASNWESISDEMWRKISNTVGGGSNAWILVPDVSVTDRLLRFLDESQQLSLVFGITANAGSGKSATIAHFTATHENAFAISCNEYMEEKDFVLEIFKSMGREPNSSRVYPMTVELLDLLKRTPYPVLILDEADKLKNKVLNFFITFYNQLEGICGINLIATSYLEKRVKTGAQSNVKGFREIYSRLGRKFIVLNEINYTDVYKICRANGVNDDKTIQSIFNESDNDLRRVKRRVIAENRKRQKNGI